MKKFLKILILIIIISLVCYAGYYYKNEFENLATNVKIEINNFFEDENEHIFTEKEIEEMLLNEDNFTIENSLIDEEYVGKFDMYYYEQLDIYSKIIYKSILNNVDKLKIGNCEVEISNSLSNLMQREDGKEAINIAFQNAWSAFRLDHPEVFDINIKNVYLTTKTTTLRNKNKYEFFLTCKEEKDIKSINNSTYEIEKKKEEIIKDLKDKNSVAKVLNIHNWLVDNLQYDVSMKRTNNNNIYGALIEKNVVCEGYAKAFKYLLDELDVPCVIICGEVIDESGNMQKHAWNEVYLNGNWYAIDVTWDDPVIIGGGNLTNELKYKYFLKGSTEINKNHYQNGRMSENDNEIEFKYPELSLQDYK